MKVKIQAGAEFDVLTPAEMDDKLKAATQSWLTELGRGVTLRHVQAQVLNLTGAPGTYSIGDKERIGPNPGFVWDVRRIAITGSALVAGTDTFSVYRGDVVSPLALQDTNRTRVAFYDKQLMLTEADRLMITGAFTGAGGDVNLSAFVVEVPVQLLWQLI